MKSTLNSLGLTLLLVPPCWLLFMAFLPSAWLRQKPIIAARMGRDGSLVSLVCAVLMLIPLSVVGPLTLGFCEKGTWSCVVYVDALSAVILNLVSFLSVVIQRYSRHYLEGEPRQGEFIRWLSLAIGSVLLLVIAGNLVVFALAWILVSLSLHQLLVFYPDRPGALLAARKKVIISRLGDGCLVAAMVLVYQNFGTLAFPELFVQVRAVSGLQVDGSIGFLLVGCALLKSAQFPFHSWLPDTMETPTPVSALMHAGIINAGGFLLMRLSPFVMPSPGALALLCVMGGFTALFASLTMLTHASVKRALAFSTVAQMGFMMLECGLGLFPLAALHLVAHSLYKAHAFLGSGNVPQLAREAWVPEGEPLAHPLILAATFPAAALLVWGALSVFRIDSFHHPGALFLSLVLVLSLAYYLWNVWNVASDAVVRSLACLLAGGVALSGVGLHWLFEHLLRGIVPPPAVGNPILDWVLVAFPFVLFVAVLIFQTQLPVWSSHPWCCALYVHARNGFYFTTLANRLVAALWPISSPRTFKR